MFDIHDCIRFIRISNEANTEPLFIEKQLVCMTYRLLRILENNALHCLANDQDMFLHIPYLGI